MEVPSPDMLPCGPSWVELVPTCLLFQVSSILVPFCRGGDQCNVFWNIPASKYFMIADRHSLA